MHSAYNDGTSRKRQGLPTILSSKKRRQMTISSMFGGCSDNGFSASPRTHDNASYSQISSQLTSSVIICIKVAHGFQIILGNLLIKLLLFQKMRSMTYC